jgi:hypothetical protein
VDLWQLRSRDVRGAKAHLWLRMRKNLARNL